MISGQPSLKISCKSVRKFLRKVANRQTDKQTNRQTNNDDYISSLAEVTKRFYLTPSSTAKHNRLSRSYSLSAAQEYNKR